MAKRPIFIPDPGRGLVRAELIEFTWHAGFAVSQKRRSIEALHEAAISCGLSSSPLEISTKSSSRLGQAMSAFNLTIGSRENGEITLEAAFQGSKVYERSGQHTSLYAMSGREAKQAASARSAEQIVGFSFDGERWPTRPTTAFYDWLYIRASLAAAHRGEIALRELCGHDGFTDIEFNPERSRNCQARSCALLVALLEVGDVDELTRDPSAFRDLLANRGYGDDPDDPPEQLAML